MATTLEAIHKHTPAMVFPLLTTVDELNMTKHNYSAYKWYMTVNIAITGI